MEISKDTLKLVNSMPMNPIDESIKEQVRLHDEAIIDAIESGHSTFVTKYSVVIEDRHEWDYDDVEEWYYDRLLGVLSYFRFNRYDDGNSVLVEHWTYDLSVRDASKIVEEYKKLYG